MRTRTKAYVCGGIFLLMFGAGWFSDHAVDEKRLEERKGQQIQGFFDEEFGPREYIKIRPKQTKEE
ncbi:hypothetical protein [Alkalicoccobacillus murimartini]|uniref:Uncharacterized protein n=1 Tax=Alkalicoccobacillus murimartini TaxID=171685 RepID=A0ABT9YD93_9BACI|nr:hypothetical protein [Alkalicoccobacillus murimartini]MDQ0205501.1 hypothetical protein [Alkalicoccobacillus murimartini]